MTYNTTPNNIENSANNNITKGYLYEKQIKDYIINHLDKLGYWIGTQKYKYKKQIEIMKNEEIRAKWKNFIESDIYSKYFK